MNSENRQAASVARTPRRRGWVKPSGTAVVCAAVLALVAGCTSAPTGPETSGTATTPSTSASASTAPWAGAFIAATPAQAQAALGTARAMWAAGDAATGEYRMTVRRMAPWADVRTESEVSSGKVKSFDVFVDPRPAGAGDKRLPDAAGDGVPRTVPELLDLVAASADANDLTVVFDRFGVPVRIDVDPVENMVDDEASFEVSWSGDGQVAAPVGPNPWTRIPRTAPIPGADRGFGTRAVLARDARGVGVYLTMYGSGSCPALPATLTIVEPAEPGPTRVAAAEVVFDTSADADRPCTADLSPTTWWAPLPAEFASAVPTPPPSVSDLGTPPGPDALTDLELVLTSARVGMNPGVAVGAVAAR